jgi:2-polyprenyl-6-hydroxyphenyl methylase/3-demethylubiquinone-9 3-methyltransferase
MHRRKVLELSGVPIYYHRCPACQFIFTTAFDHFTPHDFLQYIYNEEYVLVDPDYPETRPKGNAAFLSTLFPFAKPRSVLDYGSGNGLLAELLRAAGFPRAESFDPFVQRHSTLPAGRFDCIVCFEVLEHSTDPASVFANLSDLLIDPGIILFSTLLQPRDIDHQGLNWWYAGPRNGHVSLYTRASLAKVVRPFRFKLGSFNDAFHVLYREVPDFARRLLIAQ